MSDATPTIAIVRSYDDLRQAIATRRKSLGLAQLELDHITGLPDGYQGKIECGMRHFGALSLGLVLQALGVELVLRPHCD
jgi:predicted transcriptional regulator